MQKLAAKEKGRGNSEFNFSSKRHLHINSDQIGRNICTKKNYKLYSYKKSNDFNEYVLLMQTKIIDLNYQIGQKFIPSHFAYSLERSLKKYNLLFDHAILVNTFSGGGLIVYNKNKKLYQRPENYNSIDWKRGRHYVDEISSIFSITQPTTFDADFSPDIIINSNKIK